VGDELGFETEVGHVGFDLLSDQRSEKTQSLGLTGVDLDDLLLETTLDKFVSGKPDVLGRGHALEADFVLVALLLL
jgi:hypothetical protein